MTLFTRTILASGVLFTSSWIGLQLIKKPLEEAIALATLEILEDKEIEDDLLEFLNKIFDDLMKDLKLRDPLYEFYLKTTKHEILVNATRKLFINSFMNKVALANSIKLTSQAYFQDSDTAKLKMVHDKSLRSAFKWKSSRSNSFLIPLNNIKDQILDTKYLLFDTLFDPEKMNFSKGFENSLLLPNKAFQVSSTANREYLYNLSITTLSSPLTSSARKVINDYSNKRKSPILANPISQSKKDEFINY